MTNWKLSADGRIASRSNGVVHESTLTTAPDFLEWIAAGNTPDPADAQDISAFKRDLIDKIDTRFAQIYAAFTRFKDEYDMREAAARAYKAAGYTGAVSAWISSFSTAAGISAQAATDTIIAQADAAHSALPVLGGLRMRKYDVLNAVDLQTAQDVTADILAQANAIAAQLGV
jgi:hypothetical protein